MATALTMTSLDPVLKTLYMGSLENMVYKNHPFLAILSKYEGFVGRNLPIPVEFSHGAGGSATFADAQTNSIAPQFEDFMLTRNSDYVIGTIRGEAIEAAASDRGSFVRGLRSVMDGKMREASRRLSLALFGDGTGWVSQVDAGWGGASQTLTLTDASLAGRHEVGEQVVAASSHIANSRGTAPGDGDNATINRVDRSAGTLYTNTANWDNAAKIDNLAAGDFLFVHGDRDDSAALTAWTDMLKIQGLEGWVQPAAGNAFADNTLAFFGVDRSLESRLLGLSLDASGYSSVEEAIIDACSLCAQEGGSPDVFVLHPTKFRTLVKELGSKVQYDKLQAQGSKGALAHIGFRSVVLDSETGPVKVVSDRFCTYDYGWALDMSTLKLYTLGPAPKILMHDGNRILRDASDDIYEFRCGLRGQLGCSAPGYNCCVTLP